MTDDTNRWEITIDLRSVAVGFVAGAALLLALNAVVGAGPYLDAECSVADDGTVVEASFTNPHPEVTVDEMEQICQNRTTAAHPLLYDIRLELFGPDYTDYDPNDTQFIRV